MCVIHIAPVDTEDPYRIPDAKFDSFVSDGIDKAFQNDKKENEEDGQE